MNISKIAYWSIPIAVIIGAVEGLGIGIIAMLGALGGIIPMALVVLGILVGVYNIQRSEAQLFIIATLMIVGGAAWFAVVPYVGPMLQSIFQYLAMVAGPAAIIVAFKAVFKLGK